jgi:hypothetical protein
MSDSPNQPSASQPERLSDAEIGKDSIQAVVEAAAGTVGEVATIVTSAVRDVATAVGAFATEVFEVREAAKKAQDD